jgi:Mg/Co/Ni transporter MgtE
MSVKERLLWLLITLLTSTNAALVSGILSRAGGGRLVDTIVAGAVAFAGAEGLLLGILGFALASSRQRRP